jgi:hypothetical protein
MAKWYSECPKAPEVQLMELTAQIDRLQEQIDFLKLNIASLKAKSKDYRGMIREMHEKAEDLKRGILSIGTDEAVPKEELYRLVKQIIECAWYGDNDPRK